MLRTERLVSGWTSSVCKADSTEIHYLRSGGDLPALVALHGLLGSGRCLLPLARPLAKSFDVILPDARGHGGSSAPSEGYFYPDLAGDVVSLIRALQLDRPVLVGHSMGGMTTALAAAELGASLSGLVLVDPTFIGRARQREVFESGLVDEHRKLIATNKSELIEDARRRHPQRPLELVEDLAEARLRTSVSAFEVLTPPNPNYVDLVGQVQVPTLLVLGGKGVVSFETAHQLEMLNPRVQHDVIPNVGHGVPYDEPERLAALILAFLRKHADHFLNDRECSTHGRDDNGTGSPNIY